MSELQCPTRNALSALVRSELCEEECDVIAMHAEDCETCAEALEQLTVDIAADAWLVDCAERLRRKSAESKSDIDGKSATRAKQLGPFELSSEIGRGGMGVVYEAWHKKFKRLDAVKVMLNRSPDDAARFAREIRSAGQLKHSGILPLYEVGEENGQHFYSMPLVSGGSLQHLLQESVLAPRDAAKLVADVADAIAHAHANNVIHRDLKPANILLRVESEPGIQAGGRGSRPVYSPLVSDFGLAKNLVTDTDLTMTGQAMGSPGFASPEQAAGDSDVGRRADVYSLGAILYATLTGNPPFRAASLHDTLQQVRDYDPVPPRKLNRAVAKPLDTICMKCLRKEPGHRYATADDLAEDLRRWMSGKPIMAKPRMPWHFAIAWCRRRPSVAALIAAFVLIFAGLGASWRTSDFHLRSRQLVEQILTSDVSEVDRLVATIPNDRRIVDQCLLRELEESTNQARVLRARLALLSGHDDQLPEVCEHLLTSEPRDFPEIQAALSNHSDSITDTLVSELEDDTNGMDRRFRAACTLARYHPHEDHWQKHKTLLVEQLTRLAPSDFRYFRDGLAPAASHLREPLLEAFMSTSKSQRALAMDTLLWIAKDDEDVLFTLLINGDADEFKIVMKHTTAHRRQLVSRARAYAAAQPENLPSNVELADVALNRHAKQVARATMLLVAFDEPVSTWVMLEHSADPRSRSYFIHKFAEHGIDPAKVLQRLDANMDPSVRAALLLTLGECDVPIEAQAKLATRLHASYRHDADVELHGATEWLLRKWGRQAEVDQVVAEKAGGAYKSQHTASGDGRWFVDQVGLTMVALSAGVVRIGAPESDPLRMDGEDLRSVELRRDFCIATTEVTYDDFQRFSQQDSTIFVFTTEAAREFGLRAMELASPLERCPQTGVTWDEAAAYCNWLSEQAGVPETQWCYKSAKNGIGGVRMVSKENAAELGGYRLPTEAEWEYACRSGTRTSRYYGSDIALLSKYAWQSEVHTAAAGERYPNAFGLFDMLGNVAEWCHDEHDSTSAVDKNVARKLNDQTEMSLRGGGWGHRTRDLRASTRGFESKTARFTFVGFRVARTLAWHDAG